MPILFSVIVPTCHRNDHLRICLNQLLPSVQNFPSDSYEVIVTDDGRNSTAETLVREEFPGFQWVEGPKTGPADNRNNGASYATGKWIIFIDDDCVPSLELLRGYQNAITPEVNVYEGKITCNEGIPSLLYTSPINLCGGCFWSCNVMIKRVLFGEIGGFDTDFAMLSNEDTDLRERLKHQGNVIKFVPGAVVNHPPRPINFSARFRHHESEVRMWYLTGNRSRAKITARILRNVASITLKQAARHPLEKDTVRWLGNGIREFAYVCVNIGRWHRKYDEAFVGVAPPYEYPY